MLAWILLGVGLLLIALTAVYVAAEFSLVTVDRATVERSAAAGDATGRRLRRVLRQLSTQLSGAQVGITVTTLLLGYVMEPSLARLLRAPLSDWGMSDRTADTVAVVTALIVATVLSMVFGELVPKNIAIARPWQTARRVVTVNAVTTAACRPLIRVLGGAANGILTLFGVQPAEELRSARPVHELTSLVRRSGAQGSLDRPSARLVVQSLQFSAKCADDVLTPRVDITAVPVTSTAEEVIATSRSCGLSRFPVTGATIDDIVGLVHVKRAIAVPREDRGRVGVRQLMVDAPRVPGTMPLDDLLVLLRHRGLQMAIVVDEYDGTAGLVTLEDVVEELVGKIVDEHDRAATEVRREADGTVLVSGALRPDEIADAIGLVLPEPEEYETVAGLITERLGRLPEFGDEVVVPAVLRADAALGGADGAPGLHADGDLPRPVAVRLVVRSLAGRRVATIQLALAPPSADGEPEEGEP